MYKWFCLMTVILLWQLRGVHPTPCSFAVNGSSGVITFHSSGSYRSCSWVITAPLYHNIRLNFTTFQLTGESHTEVYDGRSTNDTLLGYFIETRRPFVVQTSDRYMLIKLLETAFCSVCVFRGVYSSSTKQDKPTLKIPIPMVRTVREHYVWCIAEGTPPINISLFNASTLLASGIGTVTSRLNFEGNYTCVARNDAGTDSRHFQVSFIGGFYSDTEAFVSDSCQKCPNGTFVHYNKAPGKSAGHCTACPQGTDTDLFAGYRACRCLQGFHRTHLFKGCKPCDQNGLQCVNEYVTLLKGYWWKWKNETHKQLYEHFAINLKNTSFSPSLRRNLSTGNDSLIEYSYALPRPHKCPRKESCTGGLHSLCATGYQGPLCEVCTDGYYKHLKTCKLCPKKEWMFGQLSILATVLVILFVIIVFTSKLKSNKREGRPLLDIILGRLKIVIGFYQVTFGVLEAFSYIKWPESLALIGKYSEILQLNVLQITPLHCLFPNLKLDAFRSLFVMLGVNIAAIALALVVYGLMELFLSQNKLSDGQKVLKTSQAKELIYRNLFFFLYITYLSTCSKTASVLPLACQTVCLDEKEENCQRFLKVAFNVNCTAPEYHQLVIVAYCAAFYITFLPTAFWIVLWKQRRKLCRDTSEGKNEISHHQETSPEAVTGLRFLFENYNSHSWYWELIETVRKVLLTSGLILVGGESRAYVGLACVISGLYGMFFAYKRPIADPFENTLMLTSLGVTFVNLGIGAVSRIPKEGVPSSIDPYVDNITFKALVFVANSLVIGLLVVQYMVYICRYMKDWRKNPQWSFSCCLALLMPLNDLQAEIGGLAKRNVGKQQLKTGDIGIPSMSSAFKDSGAVTFALEGEIIPSEERDLNNMTTKRKKCSDQSLNTLAEINKLESPKENYETSF